MNTMAERVGIVCTKCNTVFYQDEFNENNAADACKCQNVQIILKPNENSIYAFYLTIHYKEEKPKFYQVRNNVTKEL